MEIPEEFKDLTPNAEPAAIGSPLPDDGRTRVYLLGPAVNLSPPDEVAEKMNAKIRAQWAVLKAPKVRSAAQAAAGILQSIVVLWKPHVLTMVRRPDGRIMLIWGHMVNPVNKQPYSNQHVRNFVMNEAKRGKGGKGSPIMMALAMDSAAISPEMLSEPAEDLLRLITERYAIGAFDHELDTTEMDKLAAQAQRIHPPGIHPPDREPEGGGSG